MAAEECHAAAVSLHGDTMVAENPSAREVVVPTVVVPTVGEAPTEVVDTAGVGAMVLGSACRCNRRRAFESPSAARSAEAARIGWEVEVVVVARKHEVVVVARRHGVVRTAVVETEA